MLGRRLVHRSLKALSTRLLITPPSSSATITVKADKEATKEAAKAPAPQAPNYPTTWSTSQRPRPVAGENARLEQTVMALQPNPQSAMAMIANEPVRAVQGRKAVCDGGGGPLGHPKIYISLDQPGPHSCGYCGLRFEQTPHHH